MIPDLIIAPDHVDLLRVTEVVAGFLRERFADLPRDSGIERFLGTPDGYGWDVKRKLIWLGTRSYLFRLFFERYAEEQDAKISGISVIDDFLCQQTTEWAGLGALEVLAGVLDLPPGRRADLLSWSERHNAVYKVLSGDKDADRGPEPDQRPHVPGPDEPRPEPVRAGRLCLRQPGPLGRRVVLVRAQTTLGRLDAAAVARLKRDYRMRPAIYYRYSPEDLKKARELVRGHYEAFVARHGKDWVAYPDGLAMAADWQREMREKFESLPPGKKKEIKKKHGSGSPMPEMSLPEDLLDSENGIGVYFNPDEGQEIVQDFDDILSGLRKGGRT